MNHALIPPIPTERTVNSLSEILCPDRVVDTASKIFALIQKKKLPAAPDTYVPRALRTA